ncbi:uncharacterized protein [Blastocystis hominis]|uniref:MHD domain-containing protein n=1 Tax=Blastocystis hominis TaxID=12968 RepID=D8M9E9_BLAHO|nr:uncharacterized protein [Blastocystis hominis]CBK24688.2 unnamed protein product [Blastocystis hominis]|eukprot:XP_012898736.1 uncharacterized protein [Blastocystis hominis]
MSVSEFFILTLHGDRLIYHDLRSEMPKGTPELFYRTIQFWEDVNPPPVFDCDGIHFLHIRRNRFYFVFSTKVNVSPTFYLELLLRIADLISDYIGSLTEGGLRKNMTLIYELINEIMDSGYVESTSAEFLQDYVSARSENNAVQFMNKLSTLVGQDLGMKTIVDKMKSTGDLYIDVIESVHCVLDCNSQVTNSALEGTIQMRNALEGHPRFHVRLNNNIVVGRTSEDQPDALRVDDMNFHPSVDVASFEKDHVLHLTGPDGTFTAMNYRSTRPFFPPILVQPIVEYTSEYKMDIVIKLTTNFAPELRCDELYVSFHTPLITSSCKCELPAEAKKQSTDYSETKRLVIWKIVDAPGRQEFFLHVIITLTKPYDMFTVKTMGAIALHFTISNMSLSGMAVQGVDIDRLTNNPDVPEPNRWIRYKVKSSSYVCRFWSVCFTNG